MKVRPILMSGPMVRALLENRKSQTRRIVKPQPEGDTCLYDPAIGFRFKGGPNLQCPYGKPGELLWVRETWKRITPAQGTGYMGVDMRTAEIEYAATQGDMLQRKIIAPMGCVPSGFAADSKWRPSIYMPRWAARLTLELTEVRVERLLDITPADALAEGIFTPEAGYAQHGPRTPVLQYAKLWEKINGPGSWEANPWVWALTFQVHQQNVDALLKARM